MTKRDRRLERIACDVFDAAMQRRSRNVTVNVPTDSWLECDRISRLLRKAQSRRWFHAATKLEQRLAVALNSFAIRFAETQRTVSELYQRPNLATIGYVYNELIATEEEFGSVAYRREFGELSVTTEGIVLEGMDFGPFEIVLQAGNVEGSLSYRVEALDPRPAATSESTTHPHVQDSTLCEGEGQPLIKQAFQDLRLCDFFMIVRQILRTYNSSSPFVSLDDWNGIHCHDCGDTVDREDCEVCTACDVDLCGGCSYGCTSCSDRYCSNCMQVCGACLEYCCPMCSVNCDHCDLLTCKECVHDEKCPNCIEKEAEEANATDDSEVTVHAVRVGETAVAS